MKKLILTSAICTLGAVAAFSQGTLAFENVASPTSDRHPVYAPQTENPSVMVVGASSLSGPVGATVFDGGLLGSTYDFALFAGPTGIGSNNLTLVVQTVFRTSASGGLPQGLITATSGSVTGVAAGSSADFQARAWSTEGGTITSWAQAFAAFTAGDPLAQIGWTPILASAPLGGGPTLTPNATGWQSFSLIQNTPEPTSLALGGLGALGLLFFRRRK